MKNEPYVKRHDENGALIDDMPYINIEPNRHQRRSHLQKSRAVGLHRGVSLITVKESNAISRAYFRKTQMIGNKQIVHYVKKG